MRIGPLALAVFLPACVVHSVDEEGRECDSHAPCTHGRICVDGACRSPDAGADAGGHDAGADAGGPDAGTDAGGPDAGTDAGGPDAGMDAGAPDALEVGSVLIMHMDQASWNGTADEVVDSSSLGNHGRSLGANTTEGGKFGRAGLFADYKCVEVPDAPSLRPANALTLAAWIYPTTLAGAPYGIIAKRRNYQVDDSYAMFVWEESKLWVDIDSVRSSSATIFAPNRWYHVAAVFDGSLAPASRVALYVDGVLDSTHEAGAAIPGFTAPVTIGCLPLNGPAQYFFGKIDEAAIWARALSKAEIAQLYISTGPL